MTARKLRVAAVVLAFALAIAVGIVAPTILQTRGALASNDWLGLQAPAAIGVLAVCALGAARAIDGASDVWAAVTGAASLDIIQVGAKIEPDGRRHFFAAWGRGEPMAPGSLYVEQDLGPTGTGPSKYTVQLIGGAWSLSVNGVTRVRMPDTLGWAVRNAIVSAETEGAADPFGGTAAAPVTCAGAKTLAGRWTTPAWLGYGAGIKAAGARCSQGRDWFRAWS